MLSNLMFAFLNNLMPPSSCLLCGASSRHQAFCDGCAGALPWLPGLHCPLCAMPTLDGGPCGDCLKAPPAFDATCAAFLYAGTLAQLIPAAKFGARWSILPALAQLMLPALEKHPRPDLIVPLPLHPLRLKERGFNQAQEIASPLARELKVPLENACLIRTRNTEHQARLSEKARKANMRRAFSTIADLDGKHVAIVDDVMTTGTSLDAAARALKQAGASRVDAWVLARTP